MAVLVLETAVCISLRMTYISIFFKALLHVVHFYITYSMLPVWQVGILLFLLQPSHTSHIQSATDFLIPACSLTGIVKLWPGLLLRILGTKTVSCWKPSQDRLRCEEMFFASPALIKNAMMECINARQPTIMALLWALENWECCVSEKSSFCSFLFTEI